MANVDYGHRLLALKDKVAEHFDSGNWTEVGLLTGFSSVIDGHARLRRSLSFSDPDYEGNCLAVLKAIGDQSKDALATIEKYVAEKYPEAGTFISAKEAERKITFAPNVFQVPEGLPEEDLVAVMMPFAKEFDPTYAAIRAACAQVGKKCLRADDIWEESVIIQDVFNLIFKSTIVVVDFSGRNANVMYETGIAHTLGKHVVPLYQALDDLPFDLRHHKALKYLPNNEGMTKLQDQLAKRLLTLSPGNLLWSRGVNS